MTKKSEEDYIKSFKDMYGQDPTKEELKAFIECLQARKRREPT